MLRFVIFVMRTWRTGGSGGMRSTNHAGRFGPELEAAVEYQVTASEVTDDHVIRDRYRLPPGIS
jgi:hypothetical protein